MPAHLIPFRSRLLNTAEIELWPARLLRARSNGDARALAQSDWVLRRKADGRYLAAARSGDLLALVPRLAREPGIDAALDELEVLDAPGLHRYPPAPATALPLYRLHERLEQLGINPVSYAKASGLDLVAEPNWLLWAGRDHWGRPLWLDASTARAWQRMQRAASADGVSLHAISGYRSHDYQLGIFQRKLARGLALEQILTVNAAPGYSEHHSGQALDIGTSGEPPAEESFELTPAFAWLQAHARTHGFRMSFARNNPHGIVYEPWHWRYCGAAD